MSLSRQGGRRSWRVLSQLRQSSSSLLPLPPSAHLGLQSFRIYGFSISSSSPLHHFYRSPSFSSAAEAAHMANLANPDPVPPVGSVPEKQEAELSVALDSEHEEAELKKVLEEHKELVISLRAELEDQKTLTRTILDEIRVLKLSADSQTAESAESTIVNTKQTCLEWTAFMEHLQSLGFFEDENEESSSDTHSVFDDPACVRRAIHKFSRAHESVFEFLSPIDLRIIARHGSSSDDIKASAAQKRLCQFFHLGDLPSDSGSAKPEASTQPKLSDVTRLLYSTVLEATYSDDVKLSISHLLREVVILSKRPSVMPLPPAAETSLSSKLGAAFSAAALDMNNGHLKLKKEQEFKEEKGKDAQKIGTAKRGEPMKAAARLEARPVTSVGALQWKCPRCSFMNLDTKHRCVECSRRRPQRTYESDKAKSSDDVALVEDHSDANILAEGRQAKTENERKGNLLSLSTQRRENLKDRSSSLVTQEQDTAVSSSETESGNEAFSLLDDILDSEDQSDEQQEEGKLAGGLLDDSEEEQQGESKRAPLSDLFPKMKPKPPSRRGGQRDSEQRNGRKGGDRPSKNKRIEDDDDTRRSTHGSVGDDLDDDHPPPHRSRRGFNDDPPPHRSGRGFDDDNSRSHGRGGYNSFRGRGGGPRGGSSGGGRSDFLESRHNDGGLRGSSAYGDRDGGRSSNWGSRSSRGKPRF